MNQTLKNFPVKVADVIVYYAKNNHDRRRYFGTDRYKLYMKWCEYFLDKDN